MARACLCSRLATPTFTSKIHHLTLAVHSHIFSNQQHSSGYIWKPFLYYWVQIYEHRGLSRRDVVRASWKRTLAFPRPDDGGQRGRRSASRRCSVAQHSHRCLETTPKMDRPTTARPCYESFGFDGRNRRHCRRLAQARAGYRQPLGTQIHRSTSEDSLYRCDPHTFRFTPCITSCEPFYSTRV